MKHCLAIVGVGGILSGYRGLPHVNSEQKYKTQYNASETTLRDVPISKYTKAKRRHLFIYHYEVAPDIIFEDLIRLKGMDGIRWDENGTGIEDPGKGTIRWVSLAGGEIREEIMEYDPPHMHFYQIDPEKSTFKFKLKNHIAAVTVESDRKGGAIVAWANLLRLHDAPLHPIQ